MRRRVPRVRADRALELALRAGPVPVLRRLHVRERRVRLGGIGVEHDGRRRARRGLRPDFGRAEHAVVRQQPVRVGQPAVRQRQNCASSTSAFSKKSSAFRSPSSVR